MPPVMAIRWKCKRQIVSGVVPAESRVFVESSGLRQPPERYRIDRLLPKHFWHFWGGHTVEETTLDAIPVHSGGSDLRGLYRSQRIMEITTASEARSGVLSSARMWIDSIEHTRLAEAEIAVAVRSGPTVIGPKLGGKAHKSRRYVVRAPLDPPVEIRILQGSEVLECLQKEQAELGQSYQWKGYVEIDQPTYAPTGRVYPALPWLPPTALVHFDEPRPS